MVTITKHGEGRCVWCAELTEGVVTKFEDGLQGHLCRRHFWQALVLRQPKTQAKANQSSTPKVQSTQ